MTNRTKSLSTMLLYILGALSIVFILELSWIAFAGNAPLSEGGVLRDIDAIEELSIRNVGAEQDFEEVLDRPLFTWNRKPKALDSTVSETVGGDLESRWELSGIIATGATHYAYFNPVAGGQPSRLELGMYIESWQVKAIEPEQVILIGSDAEQKVFRMKEIVKPVQKKRLRAKLARRKKQPEPKGTKEDKVPVDPTQKKRPDAKD